MERQRTGAWKIAVSRRIAERGVSRARQDHLPDAGVLGWRPVITRALHAESKRYLGLSRDLRNQAAGGAGIDLRGRRHALPWVHQCSQRQALVDRRQAAA